MSQIADEYHLVGHTIQKDLDCLKIKPKDKAVDIVELVQLINKYRRETGEDNRGRKIG